MIGVSGGETGEPDTGLNGEIRAPVGVVTEEVFTEGTEDGGFEGVYVVWGRVETHLSIGEMEDEMLALVANVVVLEAEEESEPIEEVHVRLPSGREAKVADDAESGECGADFGEAEGRVVGVEVVVEWDDVVGFDVVVGVSGWQWHIIGIGRRVWRNGILWWLVG